jgi:hypothetical protein
LSRLLHLNIYEMLTGLDFSASTSNLFGAKPPTTAPKNNGPPDKDLSRSETYLYARGLPKAAI